MPDATYSPMPATPVKGRIDGEFDELTQSNMQCLDGNSAAGYVAAGLSEVALLYPVTTGQYQDVVDMIDNNKSQNCFGDICHVQQLSTTTGACTTLLGSASTGCLSTVLASSLSLQQMLPSMYQLAANRQSTVFHVGVQNTEFQSLSTGSEYSSISAVCNTGFSILHSQNVQECHDLGFAAHLASFRASCPFLHFYDGVRTANEISKINVLPQGKMAKLAEQLQDKEMYKHRRHIAKKMIPDIFDETLSQLRRVFKRRYQLFEYVGVAQPQHVIVTLSIEENATAMEHAVRYLNRSGANVGLVNVRLFRPWSAKHLLKALSWDTVQTVAVVASSKICKDLYADVSATIRTQTCRILSAEINTPVEIASAISLFAQMKEVDPPQVLVLAPPAPKDGFTPIQSTPVPVDKTRAPERAHSSKSLGSVQKTIVWNLIEKGNNNQAAADLTKLIGNNTKVFSHALSVYDSYALGGAVSSTHVHLSSCAFPSPSLSAAADLVLVTDLKLLDRYDVIAQLKRSGTLLLNTDATTDDELESVLPGNLRRDLASGTLKLALIDAKALTKNIPSELDHQDLIYQIALVLMSGYYSQDEAIANLKGHLGEKLAHSHRFRLQQFFSIVDETVKALLQVEIPESWVADGFKSPIEFLGGDLSSEQGEVVLPIQIQQPSFFAERNPYDGSEEVKATTEYWHKAARCLLFPEAYGVQQIQRPFEHETTYVVKCCKNVRLTPDDYSRNVFHIEFDTTGTDMKYSIGEALGIYGHNQTKDVEDFIDFYKLNAEDTVTVEDPKHHGLEVRSCQHVLTQVLDLFGRPSKKFYADLATYATVKTDREKLEWLAGSDGNYAFKKRVEATITFVDILKEFPSAHPCMGQLVKLIPAIKPRHYSIASSQKMHPTQVHLLVVLVDWIDPKGRQRYGQASKYLADLTPGANVTVDVCSSVLKMPENPAAPVVMAGLGTGMAPFRAFIQERAYQASQGIKVGAMVLYFGSRSKFQEYLYGDELEAYHESGLLTHLRCAFSRDGPNKVYIQDKIKQDKTILHDYLYTNANPGSFYLCGPTWPAGDVQDAIESAFCQVGKMSPGKAADLVKQMKEQERYILEVY